MAQRSLVVTALSSARAPGPTFSRPSPGSEGVWPQDFQAQGMEL